MEKYNIADAFYSIQGEGMAVGCAMMFLRFSGCNLRCSFCDTDFSTKYIFDTPTQLLTWLKSRTPKPVKDLCLTGGEPFIQIDTPLIKELMTVFPRIHIESNGTLPWPDGLLSSLADSPTGVIYLTVSPKTGSTWNTSLRPIAVKVIDEEQDLRQYTQIYGEFPCYYLQPVTTDDLVINQQNRLKTAQRVMDNPRWRLSLQTHRWVGVV